MSQICEPHARDNSSQYRRWSTFYNEIRTLQERREKRMLNNMPTDIITIFIIRIILTFIVIILKVILVGPMASISI